jgi:aryl-alcohol dehydrogenase-like predicted oxidoreductase
LYPYPADLAIVSKLGARRDANGAVLLFDEPDQLRQGLEDNLATLGVDRLPAVNLRMIDQAKPGKKFDAQLASLVRAREEGLIDGIGLSNISLEQLLRAVEQTDVVCVQNLFNLVDQSSADVLEECARCGIAFVPFFPIGGQNRLLSSQVIAALGARLRATPAQIALAWLLDLAPNILLIPGTRTRTHLAENLEAATVELDDAARAELAEHFPAAR